MLARNSIPMSLGRVAASKLLITIEKSDPHRPWSRSTFSARATLTLGKLSPIICSPRKSRASVESVVAVSESHHHHHQPRTRNSVLIGSIAMSKKKKLNRKCAGYGSRDSDVNVSLFSHRPVWSALLFISKDIQFNTSFLCFPATTAANVCIYE